MAGRKGEKPACARSKARPPWIFWEMERPLIREIRISKSEIRNKSEIQKGNRENGSTFARVGFGGFPHSRFALVSDFGIGNSKGATNEPNCLASAAVNEDHFAMNCGLPWRSLRAWLLAGVVAWSAIRGRTAE